MSRLPESALVLTAGLGHRLRPLSSVRAKAAVPVAGETLVRRILRWLAAQGIRQAVLNLHHLPGTITREVGDGATLGLDVRYSWEPVLLGSAGGPRHALELMNADRFFIVNGDTLTDVGLQALADHHERLGALVTMALIDNPSPVLYGGVAVSDDGWVHDFTTAGQDGGRSHFIGVQVVEAEAFASLPDGAPADSVNGLYRTFLDRERPRLAGYRCRASFLDVGTPRDYVETVRALAGPADAIVGRETVIHPTARLTRAILWDHVTVGAGAHLTDCVVADGVRIPPGARLADCVVVPAGTEEPRHGDRVVDQLLIAPLSMHRAAAKPTVTPDDHPH